MKRKIKDFILVADAFGPLPIWSLQHPVKEMKDALMIYQPLDTKKKDWSPWMKKLVEIEKYCTKLSTQLMDVQAYISGTATYSKYYYGDETNNVTDLKIEFINIQGFYPTKEDEKE